MTWFSKWLRWLPKTFREIHLVKGTYYYSADQCESQGKLWAGKPLELRAEPDNEYDKFAVQVWLPKTDSQRAYLLGYLPRKHSQRLSTYLQRGWILNSKIDTAYRQFGRFYLYLELEIHANRWQRLKDWLQWRH